MCICVVYMHVFVGFCLYVCLYVCVYVRMDGSTHTHTYAHPKFTATNTQARSYTHTYARLHTHTHTHTHIDTEKHKCNHCLSTHIDAISSFLHSSFLLFFFSILGDEYHLNHWTKWVVSN